MKKLDTERGERGVVDWQLGHEMQEEVCSVAVVGVVDNIDNKPVYVWGPLAKITGPGRTYYSTRPLY
jgi:hypothetical protein